MSPLGTIVGNNSSPAVVSKAHHHHPHPYYSGFNEPLLRLMSLSLVNNNPPLGAAATSAAAANTFFSNLNNLHCQAAAAAAAVATMQFKQHNHSPPITPSSVTPPKVSPSEEENEEKSPYVNNDDDEVLSIGREDPDEQQQMVIDGDSCSNSDDKDTSVAPESSISSECDDDDGQMSDRTTECLDMDEQVISPTASDSSSSQQQQHKLRHNSSSQDYHNSKEAELRKEQQAQQHRSLMFSIANILRPDFGQPPPQQQQFSPPRPIFHHPHHHHLNHHLLKLNKQSEALLRKSSHQKSHKPSRRPENHPHGVVVGNPIDLSRPASLTETLLTKSENRIRHHNHVRHQSPEKSPSKVHDRPPKNPVTSINNNNSNSNNNSESGRTTENKKKLPADKTDSNLWPAWVYCTRYSDRPSSGQFHERWLKTRFELENKGTAISRQLAKCMRNRESHLLSNTPVLASMYVNPRYKSILSEEQAQAARSSLLKTAKKILALRQTENPVNEPATEHAESRENDPYESLMRELELQRRAASGAGPRTRRTRKEKKAEIDEKRPRTAFTADQLQRLKQEFDENRYLTEKRRQDLARDLRLHENQIKIWFQNKRAKLKKSTGQRGGLALQLMAQGLYNHSTIPPKTDHEGSDSDDGC